MEAREPIEHQPGTPPPATLGDVLYADKGATLLAEGEWHALVLAAAAGDQAALHALYERAHRVVYTLAVRITSNPETAEEVTLDVFHDVWRRAAAYDPANGTVLGWIMNQARSRSIDRLRHENRKKRRDPGYDDGIGTGEDADPRDIVDLRQQGQRVRDALVDLTTEERQAIEYAYFSGLTHAEVAARVGAPLGTVKTRIRSGIAKLRHALDSAPGMA